MKQKRLLSALCVALAASCFELTACGGNPSASSNDSQGGGSSDGYEHISSSAVPKTTSV